MNTASHSIQRCSSRGSVLIVSLLFAIIIGISLVSYIALANNSLKQSSRSFYASSGVNLAEIGLEQAMSRFNQLDDTTPALAWAGWTLDDTVGTFTPSATLTIPNLEVGPGATGTVKVYAKHYTGSTPTTTPMIVAKATITQNDGPPIEKYIEVLLRKRSIFGSGVSAIEDIDVDGGSFVGKSWDSDPDNNAGTAAIPYTSGPNTANLTMGSVQGDIDLGGGTVWGYAKVSNDPNDEITGGTVVGPDGVPDDERRLNDFDAQFPVRYAPTGFVANYITGHVDSNTTFPLAAPNDKVTLEGSKQVYYYVFPPTTTDTDVYRINLASSDVLTIEPGKNVVFIIEKRPTTNPNWQATGIDIGGSASIQIGTGATLNIYTDGNVNIAGGGIVNSNDSPSSFMLWGTPGAIASPTINVVGNGVLKGVIYAPNAAVTVSGGGSGGVVAGALVGKSVRFNGTTQFFYDEALADITLGNPYGASRWKELQTATERAAYSTPLNF